MTPSEAASSLWDLAVVCGHLDARGKFGKLARGLLYRARSRALFAGVTLDHVDHATTLGLEWGRDEAAQS